MAADSEPLSLSAETASFLSFLERFGAVRLSGGFHWARRGANREFQICFCQEHRPLRKLARLKCTLRRGRPLAPTRCLSGHRPEGWRETKMHWLRLWETKIYGVIPRAFNKCCLSVNTQVAMPFNVV